MIPMVAVTIHLLASEPDAILKIAMALLVIVGLGTVFYGAENVTRAVKFKAGAGGIEGEIGGGEAQQVATAAQNKANDFKGDGG